MLKIIVEIKIKNHKQILDENSSLMSSLFNLIVPSDRKDEVENVIGKNIIRKLGKALEKALDEEGVKSEIKTYIDNRNKK